MIIQDGVLKNEVTIRGPLRNHNMLTKFFNGEEVIDAKGQKLIDVFISETGMLHTKKERKGDTPSNVLVGKSTTKNGTQMLKNMFDGNKIFDFVKPIELIRYLIEKASVYTDFIVMDFFSGSATTAHAVMQLNAEDGGNRRYIMVQLPEKCDEKSEAFKAGYKNICEIGKERIRRAGEKIKAENPDKDLDVGFRVLRVDSSNMKDVYYKPSETTQAGLLDAVDNIKNDRTDMDLLFGVMVDCGLPLDMPIETKEVNDKKYYVVNGSDALVACFEEHISEDLIREIASHKPMCAVFKDASFAEAKDKVNVSEIFKSICGDDKALKIL
jgi:adenine-specific DNA-methyltransferase